MRLAHDDERPPTYGTWLCDCHACATQARALAHTDPTAALVIKFACAPRQRVSIGEYVAADCNPYAFHPGDADGLPDDLDHVREVFVAHVAASLHESESR